MNEAEALLLTAFPCALTLFTPDEAPDGTVNVTAALLLIFCALKGATRTPRVARWRHRAVTINDLPASLEQPMIMMGLATY